MKFLLSMSKISLDCCPPIIIVLVLDFLENIDKLKVLSLCKKLWDVRNYSLLEFREYISPDRIQNISYQNRFPNIFVKNRTSYLHSDVQRIKFDDDFDFPLEPGYFPESVREIYFGNSFNQPIPIGLFPVGTRKIIFGDNFNQRLDGIIPDSVNIIGIGKKYNGKFSHNNIPSNIKQIFFLDHKCIFIGCRNYFENIKKPIIELDTHNLPKRLQIISSIQNQVILHMDLYEEKKIIIFECFKAEIEYDDPDANVSRCDPCAPHYNIKSSPFVRVFDNSIPKKINDCSCFFWQKPISRIIEFKEAKYINKFLQKITRRLMKKYLYYKAVSELKEYDNLLSSIMVNSHYYFVLEYQNKN